jgi:hypothetical protein
VVDRRAAWVEVLLRGGMDRVGNENPGGSRNKVECESPSPKGQGFLGNANQPRVS